MLLSSLPSLRWAALKNRHSRSIVGAIGDGGEGRFEQTQARWLSVAVSADGANQEGAAGSESFDGVVTFDGRSDAPPLTVPDSVLVNLERRGVLEDLFDAPHQGVLGWGHGERDASSFGAGQFDMTGEISRDESGFLLVPAHESATEMNIVHELIVGPSLGRPQFARQPRRRLQNRHPR